MVKIDALGEKLWDRRFGGSGEDICSGAIATSDGNFLLYGYSDSPSGGDKSEDSRGADDFWIILIDANGDKLWDKRFGGGVQDFAYSALELTGGDFVLTGSSRSLAGGDKSEDRYGGDEDVWVIRIDSSGNKLWDKRYGGTGGEICQDIKISHSGNLMLFCTSSGPADGDLTEEPRGYTDFMLLEIDLNGVLLWQARYGGDLQDPGKAFLKTEDGGYLLVGYSHSDISGEVTQDSFGSSDTWVIKTDASGNKIWDQRFGGTDDDSSFDVFQKQNGNYLILGQSRSSISGNKTVENLGKKDFWLLEIDNHGNKISEKIFGGDEAEIGKSILVSSDSGYIFAGHSGSGVGLGKSEPNQGLYDYWVVKTDTDGNRNHQATDPDGDTLAWSISGGADSYKFIINAATGELSFNSADFEDPQDADQNNTYEVTIRATDSGGLFAEQSINIEVEDVYEPSRENHTVELNSTVSLEMIWVEPGTFMMGSPETEAGRSNDETQHEVTLTKGFYLGKYEVTQAQYEAVMTGNDEGLSATPSYFNGYPEPPCGTGVLE